MRPIDRIVQYIDSKGIKPKQFEDKIAAGNGYIAAQKKGKGGIGSDILEKILNNYPDLNIIWIITGEGEMLEPPKPELTDDEKDLLGNNPELDAEKLMDEYYRRKEALKQEVIDDIIKRLTK